MANDKKAAPETLAAGERVMLNDGNWDTVAEVVSGPDAGGVVTVSAVKAKRKAKVARNEHGVWQEAWKE